jgi:hypothetical protein
MSYYKLILGGCFLSLALSVGALGLHAQDEPQNPDDDKTKPKPAGTTYPIPTVDAGSQDQNNTPDTTNGLQPDTTPLTGIQDATLGSPETRHSYWVPGFQYAGTIQSNGFGQANNSGWVMNNYLVGNISLLKAWSRSELAVNYSGGGFFSTDSALGNGTYQRLALAQNFEWNRWAMQILEHFSYLPQSQFGFGGGTNLGVPGVGSIGPTIPGLGLGYVPNQSIYAAFGPQYSNVTALQVTYATSRRGSITASGSYGTLNFVDPGNVDNSTTSGTVGYNYELTRQNSIGGFYRFSGYHFAGQPQAFGSNSFNLAFSRKLTGRMALQAYGGPEITTFRIPVDGQSSKIGANLGVTLDYAFKDGGLAGRYFHGVTGGSGVFTGSTVDQVILTANRRLSRVWTGHLNFGYAHNKSIVSSTTASSAGYNSWFLGGGVTRPFGRNATVAIAYNADISSYTPSGCTGNSCSSNQTTSSSIIVNFQWHTRPMVLP